MKYGIISIPENLLVTDCPRFLGPSSAYLYPLIMPLKHPATLIGDNDGLNMHVTQCQFIPSHITGSLPACM